MEIPRNMTGLYLGGFIQEGYLPPRERKSTIPSTLYRGHVVKIARAPNANPHRSSVGRYPMHSLNSGFTGSKVPIKDQNNFKSPEEQRDYSRPRTRGKWTDYPMSIEIKKMAGSGASGTLLAECVLTGKCVTSSRSVSPRTEGALSSAAMRFSPTQYRDQDEDNFYQTMFEEIRQVVTSQDEVMKRNREKLARILINDSNVTLRPDVVSPARGHKRVATSYAQQRRGIPKTPGPKRPHTTLPPSGSLLLPVPFVTQQRPHTRGQQTTPRPNNPTQWLPSVMNASPRIQRFSAGRSYRDDGGRWNTPEPLAPGVTSQSNIGLSSFERLQKLLEQAAQDEMESNPELQSQQHKQVHNQKVATVKEIASRRAVTEIELNRVDVCTSPEALDILPPLSVILPNSYREENSLSSTPLPVTPDPRALTPDVIRLTPEPRHVMGSAASKSSKRKDHTPSPPPSEVSIKLTVEGEDGKLEPVAFDMDAVVKKKDRNSIEVILDKVETHAERKRRELELLLIEHRQIVDEIARLENEKLH